MSSGRPFTGGTLDRVSVERNDPEWVRALAASPAARAVAAGRDDVLVDSDGTGLRRLTVTRELLGETPLLLGTQDGGGIFAVDLERAADRNRPADDGSWGHDTASGRLVSLREAGLQLPPAEGGLAAYSAALLWWHRRHRFCANCGALTDVEAAGLARRCPDCGAQHFPRTDPVVIMTVEHDGRLLLGRRAGWPSGRLSVLAGFVSQGESPEEAVLREIQEESGIVCHDPVYVTSQPWPFPSSLMLGFHALADGGEPRPTDGELDEVRWVSRDVIRDAVAGRDVGFALPGEVSIARYLIEHWAA